MFEPYKFIINISSYYKAILTKVIAKLTLCWNKLKNLSNTIYNDTIIFI